MIFTGVGIIWKICMSPDNKLQGSLFKADSED